MRPHACTHRSPEAPLTLALGVSETQPHGSTELSPPGSPAAAWPRAQHLGRGATAIAGPCSPGRRSPSVGRPDQHTLRRGRSGRGLREGGALQDPGQSRSRPGLAPPPPSLSAQPRPRPDLPPGQAPPQTGPTPALAPPFFLCILV